MKLQNLIPLAMVMTVTALGCTDQSRDQYAGAGQDVGKALEKTGQAVAKDAQAAQVAASGPLMTAKIKSSLQTASGLITKNLDVDTDAKTKVVTLSGSVPTAEQKKQAEDLARGIAGNEYKFVSKLQVVAK